MTGVVFLDHYAIPVLIAIVVGVALRLLLNLRPARYYDERHDSLLEEFGADGMLGGVCLFIALLACATIFFNPFPLVEALAGAVIGVLAALWIEPFRSPPAP